MKKIYEIETISDAIVMAWENWNPDFETVIHIDECDKLHINIWTSNTYLNPERGLSEIYRIPQNVLGNASYKTVGEIISTDEAEEIFTKFLTDEEIDNTSISEKIELVEEQGHNFECLVDDWLEENGESRKSRWQKNQIDNSDDLALKIYNEQFKD